MQATSDDLYTPITPRAFRHIQEMFRNESGIDLPPAKQALVASRLRKRLDHHQIDNFDDYCALLVSPDEQEERRIVIDLLTTNETYFFREPEHFRHLGNQVLPQLNSRPLRVWCAASSTGEEPYSLAMTLAEKSPTQNWQLVATDLSRRVLSHAQRAVYDMQRLQNMPKDYLKQYCLKGTGQYEGFLKINAALCEKVSFREHNLLDTPKALGQFDVIFMRNVLIYFDSDMKQKIVSNAMEALPSGGWFYTGHSESLHGLDLPLKAVVPSVYRKL